MATTPAIRCWSSMVFLAATCRRPLIDEQARRAGVHLIAPDRPGFGGSTPAPERTILSWVGDVRHLANHLELVRFGILGISCGGACALACAHELGERLHYASLIAGMGPMDDPTTRRRARPRGFAIGHIRIPMHVYQGRFDRNVPPRMGEYIATQIPAGHYRFFPEEGHLSIVCNTAESTWEILSLRCRISPRFAGVMQARLRPFAGGRSWSRHARARL